MLVKDSYTLAPAACRFCTLNHTPCVDTLYDEWDATFTARIKNRHTKAEGLVTVIVERADPAVAGQPPTVAVEVDNVLGVNGTLREPPSAILIR